MTHKEEILVVANALNYEKEVQKYRNEYFRIKNVEEPRKPNGPSKRNVQKSPYPNVTSNKKFNWVITLVPMFILFGIGAFIGTIGIIPTIAAWVWLFVCIKSYKNAIKKNAEELKGQPEYKAACAEIDRLYQEELAKAETEYNKDLEQYNNVTLSKYDEDLSKWRAKHNSELAVVMGSLDNAEKRLSNYYETTKVIPAKYHDIEALENIYSTISTSQYTLKECFDDYERHKSQLLEQERIRELQYANSLAQAQIELTAEQNELLDEQNYIADRARKEQNLSNVVRAVQHHNTNKILKGRK